MNLFLVFSIFILCYLLFTWKAGKIYPILYLFLLTYFLQYVFSVYLIYNKYPILRKQMPIPEGQLFEYIIPALLFLFAGVFIFNKDVPISNLIEKINRKQAANLGHFLLFISYLFDILSFFGLPGVSSILSFTQYLKYVGGICYLFAPSGINYSLLFLAYFSLAREAVMSSVFLDFFMWSTYLYLIASLRYRLSLKVRLSFILIAAPLLILIQSIKFEYRQATWSGKRSSGVGLLKELAEKKQREQNDPFANSEGVIRTVGRLNQGWHLGMVLKWVPKHQSLSNGEDFLGDIQGSILPRFFFPEKKEIGSRDKFYKYTGHKLTGGTSMTIGVLGDFYVNFGRWGSFVGLFILGACVSRALYFFIRKHVLPDPINIIWIPFLFSYLVRANNDFYVVINSFVKGYLIFLFITFLRKQFWPAPVVRNLSQ